MAKLTKRVGENITYSQERKIECCVYCDECSQGTANCKTVREMVKKLADYEDAEEQRLFLRLPCKVGDTLYLPYSRPRYIKEVMVTDFMFNGCDLHILTDFVTLGNRDIGKTVFLTKEEAEQALAEMKGV